MITSQFFGHPRLHRNLGNHLFELASLIGLARRYNTELYLPDYWQNAIFFNLSPFVVFEPRDSFITIEEPAFDCCLDFFDRLKFLIQNENVNIEGFLQTEKYWKLVENEVRQILSFKDHIKKKSIEFINLHNVDVEKFVAISVRRGDFVTDPNHYLLPIEYYLGAYYKYFSDKNLIIFSDDIQWCKNNFKIDNKTIIFAQNMTGIEQMSLMTFFNSFIIANSTFSWWGAYLSTDINKNVIRPFHHFDGELKKSKNIKDHYPEEWLVYNFETDKIK